MITEKVGQLYCLYNKMYESYGNDVYKLGHSSNPSKRILGYMTSYIDDSEFKYVTPRKFQNSLQAERILFFLLRRHRIKKNREFFRCNLDCIIDTIKRIESMPDEKIERIYKIILNDFCSDRVFENIEDSSHFLDCMASPDLFFEQFRFRPKNPEMYRKFGYIEPQENDWYVLQNRLYTISQTCDGKGVEDLSDDNEVNSSSVDIFSSEEELSS